MSHDNLFEWQIIASLIVRGNDTTCRSWGKDTGTSSSARVTLEVAMILNPLCFSGVQVLLLLFAYSDVTLLQQTVKLATKKPKQDLKAEVAL